jgi:hypothetical protein
MKILVKSEASEDWESAEPVTAKVEADLQRLLLESPSLIPIDEMREGISPLVVAVGEFGLPGSGSTDMLAFTADGDVAVIECKLAGNPESKRKVIGQILEYAAFLWGMTYDEVDERVKLRKEGKALSELIEAAVAGQWEEPSFRAGLSETLRNGGFVLIIVVDELNDELRRIIRYVNECGTSGYSLHALEVRRYRSKGVDMLIPRLHGTSVKQTPSAVKRKKWSEPEFFEKLQAATDETTAQIVRDLFEWCRNTADRVWFGTGVETGSFTFHYLKEGATVSVFTVYTNGKLMLNYGWLLPHFSQEFVKALHDRVTAIPTFRRIPDDFTKWPSIWIEEAFPSSNEIEEFKAAVEWLRERIRE